MADDVSHRLPEGPSQGGICNGRQFGYVAIHVAADAGCGEHFLGAAQLGCQARLPVADNSFPNVLQSSPSNALDVEHFLHRSFGRLWYKCPRTNNDYRCAWVAGLEASV